MADDLGARAREVHAAAQGVLTFWFDETTEEQWFAKDDTLDRTIAARFGALRDAVLASGAAGWDGDPDTLLAAIILLDQFSRNIHRGSREAFAADSLSLDLTHRALARGWDETIAPERRAFLYMPLMHAEDREEQRLSVDCFTRLGNAENLDFARKHRAVIDRFGRFPSRNQALGRVSTEAEKAYVSQPGAGW
ncbi:DUF924 family protein [Hephaestia mangrovi]|uniref:DUF924 family protein n=1 Tax=Hephaestia mangrovi TaxID=2873268 RepID=UPI001CA62F28|nr:DUF924 family protein [Hephaestia mangrovi]MBY8827137.1 DUF924 domain-containing protein [Hephaestia mangrovi]